MKGLWAKSNIWILTAAGIAVAAYIENAGFGATWACPIASLLVEKYLTGGIREERKYVEDRVLQGDLMSRVKKD